MVTGRPERDLAFAGSVPELYDRYLVPLLFEFYAEDIASRVAAMDVSLLLEVAAGTGVVTRALARRLPASVAIIATDLNRPMVDHAASVGTSRPVRWEAADVMALPYGDATFDVVVCQFGAMFLPDRVAGFTEIARVLRPGGVYLFNVWDRIEHNHLANIVTETLAVLFPDDPPRFLARTPHGYHDEARIRSDVSAAGFAPSIGFESLRSHSRAANGEIPAIAYCQGTPLRNEIEACHPGRLDEATRAAAEALRNRYGEFELSGEIRAFVITATKPS